MPKSKAPPRLFDLSPRKSRGDLWLIFDCTISEIVRSWAEAHPEAIGEAISKLGRFFQLKKIPRDGSEPYFSLISRNIIVSRDVPRAAAIAFETLVKIERDRETVEEA